MRTLLIILCVSLTIGLSGCAHAKAHYSELPADAFTVSQDKLHEVTSIDGSIPKKYWSDPILKLEPLRVISHRVNIAVVTSENNKTFSGVYFSVPISSYLPVDSDTETYFMDSKDNLLHFTFKK